MKSTWRSFLLSKQTISFYDFSGIHSFLFPYKSIHSGHSFLFSFLIVLETQANTPALTLMNSSCFSFPAKLNVAEDLIVAPPKVFCFIVKGFHVKIHQDF